MNVDVQLIITKLLENWLKEGSQGSIELVTEDVSFTIHIFCDCLDQILVHYEVMGDSLVIGNKKIWVYDKNLIYR